MNTATTMGVDLSYIDKNLRQFAVSIDSLKADTKNLRVHSQRNKEAIKASLIKFGQRTPLFAQEKSRIVRVGNARMEAMQELGWTHAAVLFKDEDNLAALQYALADNRTAELAGWNYELLTDTLKDFDDQGIDLLELGFSPEDAEPLLKADFSPPVIDTSIGHQTQTVQVKINNQNDHNRLIITVKMQGYLDSIYDYEEDELMDDASIIEQALSQYLNVLKEE